MNAKKRFFDLFVQTPVMIGFLALCGLVTYLLIMLLNWIGELGGAFGVTRTVVVGINVFIGLAIFFFATFLYMQRIGSNDFNFLKDNGIGGENAKPALWSAMACFAIALGVYGILMYLISRADWYFFQGPMAYITLALNVRWGTGITIQYVSAWCKLVGFICQCVVVFPAMIGGYVYGFKKKKKQS